MSDNACKATHTVAPDLDLRCCGIEGHEPPHYWMKVWTTEESQPEPEPVPEWRRLVDRQADDPLDRSPLGEVLACLTDIEGCWHEPTDQPGPETDSLLARIVAVCEAQVGDGWRAEPRRSADTGLCTAWELLGVLAGNQDGYTQPRDEDWRCLGDAAAAWLATLTGEAS